MNILEIEQTLFSHSFCLTAIGTHGYIRINMYTMKEMVLSIYKGDPRMRIRIHRYRCGRPHIQGGPSYSLNLAILFFTELEW